MHIMAERVDAATLDGLSKKELVVLVQSVAPLDLLQANALSGKPENVAKKANKVQTLECFCHSLARAPPFKDNNIEGYHWNFYECPPPPCTLSLLPSRALSPSRSRSRSCFLSPSLLPSLTLSPQDKIIEVYNKVFDDGLITSEADREAARSSR